MFIDFMKCFVADDEIGLRTLILAIAYFLLGPLLYQRPGTGTKNNGYTVCSN